MKFEQYYTDRVLMVEPTNFYYNEQAAEDNEFMKKVALDDATVKRQANEEFKKMVKILEDAGIEVVVYKQQTEDSPDSVFPNNWLTTHKYPGSIDKGLVCAYPMKTKNRQNEVNYDIVEELAKEINGRIIDFTAYKYKNKPCEGTGVLIFDPINLKVYANLSLRCVEEAFCHFIEVFNNHTQQTYELVTFSAASDSGAPIYHTNVMFALLPHHAVLCLSAIKDDQERKKIEEEITSKDLNVHTRKIIDLSMDEILQMCGNILCIKNKEKELCILMSTKAYNGFTKEHREELEKYYKIIHADIETIEDIGGGSARCMVAEIFH